MKKICSYIFCLIFLGCAVFIFSNCNISQNKTSAEHFKDDDFNKKVSFACWNVQTFFDAKTNGNEYAEFKKEGTWSAEKYSVRLKRLCEVLCNLNPDVFVLEEVESLSVVQDISNFLAGNSWSEKKRWNYVCFAKNKDSAIGCAVFSRFELQDLKIHNLDVRIQKKDQPNSRPVMQVCINVDGKKLILFVNHWKSKSGGEAESEIWRDWQEALLAFCAKYEFETSQNTAFVFCGDFNRDADEFVCDFKGLNEVFDDYEFETNVVLRTFNLNECKSDFVRVFSPWFCKSGNFSTEKGSYFYKENWERIDNIFAFGSLKISDFTPAFEGTWTKENGIPFKYMIYNGEGYSDHLPLTCNLLF